ncbi:carcinoembryonic antigen-related cell adhesion molecule 5-like [Saccostrea echinata]|uniref:carcinoembryonic antigen-related cell adhesion molecule 5-like n=1 Tax=Saccostrea echinata TaxID=191078 RepID=UPI002A7F3B67|nr:carcinoembryonic antigen-related cell adhesion molecule 5-like [Saccostrea echinata]
MEIHTTCLFILIFAEGISSITVTTNSEINVTLGSNTPIVLNCTYPTEITVETIKWKKLVHGVNKYLARFDPRQSDASLAGDGIYLVNRSNLINPKNSSRSAVLIINDVKCEDDGKYQCFVEYKDGVLIKEATSKTTVFLQVEAEQPTSFEFYQNGTLKENDKVFLSCSANVGNPGGFVAIWKLNKLSNQPIILNKSSEVVEKTENCTAVANLSITYTVSRDDNGAIFRCSSQNRQTQEPAPYNDTIAIDVYYGPSNVTIISSAPHLDLFVGANVNLTCSSDGNPLPSFKWKFNSSDVLNDERHSLTQDNRTLILRKMVSNDSGIYSCFALNVVDGDTLKMSSNKSLIIKEKHKEDVEASQPTCGESQCKISEICSEIDGRAVCDVNYWFFAALVFMFFTMIFIVTTTFLCIRRSRHKNNSINFNGEVKSGALIKSQANDYDLDGYSDPKDVTKLCQNTEESGSENVAYADPVDSNNQYASAKKDLPNPSNPPNVYDGAWV